MSFPNGGSRWNKRWGKVSHILATLSVGPHLRDVVLWPDLLPIT
jgi:hypothetical protein